jgi:hypothetical protein
MAAILTDHQDHIWLLRIYELGHTKEDWPEEMSLSGHKEWETGLRNAKARAAQQGKLSSIMSGGWKRYASKCHVKSDWLPIPISISFLTNT